MVQDLWDELSTEPNLDEVSWQELTEEFVRWTEPGQQIIGRVGPKQVVMLENGNTGLRRSLQGAGGVVYTFLSPMQLEALLERVGEHALVRIEYLGEQSVKSGRSMKSFKVARASK
jgi:hypothetical protein